MLRDAFRVLKRGGRNAISDVVATAPLPEEARKDMALFTGCMAGASLIDDIEKMLKDAGFKNISIKPKEGSLSPQRLLTWLIFGGTFPLV